MDHLLDPYILPIYVLTFPLAHLSAHYFAQTATIKSVQNLIQTLTKIYTETLEKCTFTKPKKSIKNT